MSHEAAIAGGKRWRLPPGGALLLIAPVLGELVSCHQPPREFFNPLVFILLALPYGFGALLCRELCVRWNKGLSALLLLGLAYGLYEEAIVVRSLFNPNWQELGAMGRYGFFAGVHWIYGVMLLHFHVYVSIVASVVLAETLYPDRRRQPWLSRTGFVLCALGLLLWWPAGWLMTQYRPPVVFLLLPWVAIGGLAFAARCSAPLGSERPARTTPGPHWFFLLGLVSLAAVFMLIGIGAEAKIPPATVTALILAVVEIVTIWLLLRYSGNGSAWDDRHRLAWVVGTLTFFLLFGVAQDLEGFQGRSLVSFITIYALLRHQRGIHARLPDPLLVLG